MEDVLDVYQRAYDPLYPVVCLDEQLRQLVKELRPRIPGKPRQTACLDYEYERNGTANLFLMFEPLRGWRQVNVTKQRTQLDFAEVVRELADDIYPEAQKIVLVMDNLNTHRIASLYEAFPPEEAHRLAGRLEIHHTPKHGSWLNMAEIELSVLTRQCLDERIGEEETLRDKIQVWEIARNESQATVDWQFKTEDARIKLKKLYPSTQPG